MARSCLPGGAARGVIYGAFSVLLAAQVVLSVLGRSWSAGTLAIFVFSRSELCDVLLRLFLPSGSSDLSHEREQILDDIGHLEAEQALHRQQGTQLSASRAGMLRDLRARLRGLPTWPSCCFVELPILLPAIVYWAGVVYPLANIIIHWRHPVKASGMLAFCSALAGFGCIALDGFLFFFCYETGLQAPMMVDGDGDASRGSSVLESPIIAKNLQRGPGKGSGARASTGSHRPMSDSSGSMLSSNNNLHMSGSGVRLRGSTGGGLLDEDDLIGIGHMTEPPAAVGERTPLVDPWGGSGFSGYGNAYSEQEHSGEWTLREDYRSFVWLFVKDFAPIVGVLVLSTLLWCDPKWKNLDTAGVLFVCVFMLLDTAQLLSDFYFPSQTPYGGTPTTMKISSLQNGGVVDQERDRAV